MIAPPQSGVLEYSGDGNSKTHYSITQISIRLSVDADEKTAGVLNQ